MPIEMTKAIAKPIEIFHIDGNGWTNILTVCPVCGQAGWIEGVPNLSKLLDPLDADGGRVDMAPMKLVCEACDAYARQMIDGRVLDQLLRNGELPAHEVIVRWLAGPRRMTLPRKLADVDGIWEWLWSLAAVEEVYEPSYYLSNFVLDTIVEVLCEPNPEAA